MNRRIGFSTGALAFGNFARGVSLQDRDGVRAIELSALRVHELQGAVDALPLLDIPRFEYRSFHAPSDFGDMTDAKVVERLRPVVERNMPIVVHPDAVSDWGPWRELGPLVLLENMDPRKGGYRTAREMAAAFDRVPDAQFCFDIGHARRIDPTMSVALDLLVRLRDRLAEVHISEVTTDCSHAAISTPAALAFRRMARLIPETVPVIIESVVSEARIDAELLIARRYLDSSEPLLSNSPTPASLVTQ